MDEEMFTLHNIMPVELALKRELEYRRRMERGDLMKPLVIIQGTPPGQSGIKRDVSGNSKRPTLELSSRCPAFEEQLGFSCKACQLTFDSVFNLSSHYVSQIHKTNVSQMKKRREALSNPIWCELCQSSCSGLNELGMHLNGSRHAASLLKFENERRATLQKS